MKPGYKQTEVGVIPEEWETQTVLGISRQIIDYRGRTPRKLGMEWGQGEIPALSAGNVKMGFIDFSQECYFGSEALYERWMTQGEAHKDDIIFTTEAPLGNVALIPDERKYILSQRTVLLQIDPQQASSRFLFQFMLSAQFQKILADYSSGSTAKGIQRKKFEQLRLAKPPLPEQCAIATALSDVDGLLGGLDRLIAKKRDLKQAAMQQLLTGQTRLPGFHAEWEVKQLGEIAHIKTGSRNNEDKVEDGQYPFFVRSEVVERINSYSHDCEAILVPGEGRIGDIFHYINGRFDVHQRVYAITKFVPGISGRFIHFFLAKNFGAWAMQNTVKATVDSLRLPTFQKFKMRLPPTEAEQTAIASVLTEMDGELAALTQRREKTRALKQAMMQELLTGKTRLI